ncbi:hypothetical protein [Streptomyces sp. SCL15-4]|uniref:hypothetical protein n=1 Tax=Streptomyces sp. SCL15-4 TaxID=2967221 RepID=UPI002965FAB0|nr:hypothetical protein [Streptomyces sp. SCL15-4]
MTFDITQFGHSRWFKTHPQRVYTHGSLEPVLSILDVRGFELRDLVLMGLNDSCGMLLLQTESRAENAAAALEPAYATTVERPRPYSEAEAWAVTYTRRALDGAVLSAFIANLTLEDGRQVIKDGHWVR